VLGLPNERFFPVYSIAPLEAEFNAAAIVVIAALQRVANLQQANWPGPLGRTTLDDGGGFGASARARPIGAGRLNRADSGPSCYNEKTSKSSEVVAVQAYPL
jgi:hypothetical protein